MKKLLLPLMMGTALATPAYAETTLSGLVEIEAGYSKSDDDSSSDVSLATVELGVDTELNEKLDGHILFLYEQGENDDNIALDEATLTFKPREGLDIIAGRMYVPFGRFDSNMVSDPLTLELGETQEEAVLVGMSNGNVSGSAYVFKDDEDESDKIDDFGVNLDYETDNFAAGVSYISDVNDKSTVDVEASGVGIHASGKLGHTNLIAEHIQLDEIDGGEKPSASNLEVGFDLGKERTIAVAYQKTRQAESLDLPKTAAGIAYSMPIFEKASFAAEYMNNKAYDGTKEDVVTLQVAYEF